MKTSAVEQDGRGDEKKEKKDEQGAERPRGDARTARVQQRWLASDFGFPIVGRLVVDHKAPRF